MYIVLDIKGKKVLITKEDIDDIMCSALEGGICHWCWRCDVVEDDYYGEYAHEQISNLGSLRMYLIESFGENETCVLSLGNFLRGIKFYLNAHDLSNSLNTVLELDYTCNKYRISSTWIDGIMADIVVQYALFGDILFS